MGIFLTTEKRGHNEVAKEWKLPPDHPAFSNARCDDHDTVLVVRGTLLVCPDCTADWGDHRKGRFYPRKCRDCGVPFLTRVMHQGRCDSCVR